MYVCCHYSYEHFHFIYSVLCVVCKLRTFIALFRLVTVSVMRAAD